MSEPQLSYLRCQSQAFPPVFKDDQYVMLLWGWPASGYMLAPWLQQALFLSMHADPSWFTRLGLTTAAENHFIACSCGTAQEATSS